MPLLGKDMAPKKEKGRLSKSLANPARSHLVPCSTICHGGTEDVQQMLLQAGHSTQVPQGLARFLPEHGWTNWAHVSCETA